MMLIKNDIHICRTREQVYDFLRDFRNIPEWNYYVKRVFATGFNHTGVVYRQERLNDEQNFEVLEAVPHEKIVIRTLPGQNISFIHEFTLECDHWGQCIVHDRFYLDTGHTGFFQALFKKKLKKAVRQNLNKLKILLDPGQVKLQDGTVKTLKINNQSYEKAEC